MPHIYYLPDEKLVEIGDTDTILQTSVSAGIPHTHVCGGSARCSTCRVWVLDGLELCTPRNDAEQALSRRLGLDDRIRLACQTQIVGEGQITVRRMAVDSEDLDLIDDQVQKRIPQGAIGQEKYVAILFSDIRGFTSFSEALPAYDVIYVLNRYFHQMGRAIAHNGGIINNYMGDGFMALFGWDNPQGAAERAVRAGLDMLVALETFNAYLEGMYHRRLTIGIGIHYGQVVIGSVGASRQNQQMTAIGDAVNLASRIEAMTKKVKANLLISEDAYSEITPLVTVGQSYTVEIPGKTGHYVLYEVQHMLPPRVEPETAITSATMRFPGPFAWTRRVLRMIQKVLQL